MRAFFSKLFVLVVLSLSWTGAAYAQQGGNAELYDLVPPAGSTFVRVLNLSSGAVSVTLSGKVNPQQVAAGQLSGYRFVPKGKHTIAVGSQSIEADLKPEAGVTVLFDGKSLKVLADPFVNEQRKAQVAFYNLTPQRVALKTLDGKHAVVEALDQNQTGGRQINESKIAFAAYVGEQKVATFDELFLRKGRTYSYLLFAEGTGYRAVALANGVDLTE